MSKQIKFINGNMFEYEIYKLVDEYDPFLKTKPKPFDFNAPGATTIAKYHTISMLETMMKKRGVGLASNQVGVDVRMFVMGSEGVGFGFFNPEITDTRGITDFAEGCLSFPGLFLAIKRPESVKIKYTDMNGVEQEKWFDGLSARVVLHEYDHMEGIVFTSKVSPIILERQKRKVKKNLRLLADQFERADKEAIIRQAAQKVLIEKRSQMTEEQLQAVGGEAFKAHQNLEQARADHFEHNERKPDYAKPDVQYVAEKPEEIKVDGNQELTIDTSK